MRYSGILLHISSLPSNYGIGTFGKKAYEFIDFLVKAGQTYWQILPLGPTSFGNSPYQTLSVYAINPYFIDLDIFIEEKLLTSDEIIDSTFKKTTISFEKLFKERLTVLKKAFNRFNQAETAYQMFLKDHAHWLFDYALFMAIKGLYNHQSWSAWPKELKMRDQMTLDHIKIDLKNVIHFHYFLQYKAYEQWYKLKSYANAKGIYIIGDMPIYVAHDAVDVWAKPDYFILDQNLDPTLVAGVPPDDFSPEGQVWGNPLYRWDILELHHYDWWLKRIEAQTALFDLLRIDHFIGFAHYFGIPFKDKTAINGKWYPGPGQKLFSTIKEKLGDQKIIAEDLGIITDDVKALLKYTGFPGMKVLHFAFNTNELSPDLPHNYTKNVVVYTGTHDNDTTKSWFKTRSKTNLKFILNYINHQGKSKTDSLIKEALKNVADTVIIPLQDYLDLDNKARMNTPATFGNNWVWRMKENDLTDALTQKIYDFSQLFDRLKK